MVQDPPQAVSVRSKVSTSGVVDVINVQAGKLAGGPSPGPCCSPVRVGHCCRCCPSQKSAWPFLLALLNAQGNEGTACVASLKVHELKALKAHCLGCVKASHDDG